MLSLLGFSMMAEQHRAAQFSQSHELFSHESPCFMVIFPLSMSLRSATPWQAKSERYGLV